VLGKGAFSVVYEAYKTKKFKRVAVKSISKSLLISNKSFATSMLREIEILRCVQHTYLIKMEKVYEAEDSVNLLFEYLSGGDLRIKVLTKGTIAEETALKIVIQIMQGVSFLHSHNILHRDLKPANIFFLYFYFILLYRKDQKGMRIKIADFGMATQIDENGAISLTCGSPGYMAPEMLKRIPYNIKVDIYSCGIILYFM